MRLSDLLDAEVVDSSGSRIGRVHDVRMVQDGPVQGTFGAALRIRGLIVGRPGLGARLGLDRADVKGPWVVKAFFRAIRTDLYVEWERVRSLGQDRVVISGSESDLPRAATSE
jgi:sporulation protein YlmC with PRC-barrel domain